MTKERKPLTPHRALSKIADALGWDACAEVIGKAETTLRKYSDPDTGRELSLRDAIRLDAAYRRDGGIGAPLFEAYAAAIDLGFPADADAARCLYSAASKAAKEVGEAVSAAIDAAINCDDPALMALARKEVGEGLEAMQTLYTHSQRGTK